MHVSLLGFQISLNKVCMRKQRLKMKKKLFFLKMSWYKKEEKNDF